MQRGRLRHLLVAGFLTTAVPSASGESADAPPAPPPRRSLGLGVSHEVLSNNQPSWQSLYLLGSWQDADRRSFYGGVRETTRYDRRDSEAHLGGALLLTSGTHLLVEAGFSPSHQVLPARYGYVGLQQQLAREWSLTAGFRRAFYDSGQARIASLGLEHYTGNERFAYTLYLGAPDGAPLAGSHRWQWAHYYGDRDWFGLTLIHGRETENLGATGLQTLKSRGGLVSGRHGIAADWALVWEVGSIELGDFHRRRGIRLGLSHAF